jgi:exopolysaccharide production protein ExoZ
MTSTEPKDNSVSEVPLERMPTLPSVLINIQFLRFTAAMLVVIYHTSTHVKSTGIQQGWFFSIGEAVGFAGVDVFFVISGFIMAYTTASSTGFRPGIDFARRRGARIYSGYWPFYLLAIALYAWISGEFLANANLWRSAILWPTVSPLIVVSWTLVYEIFFYIVFTLLIMIAGSYRKLIFKVLLLAIVSWSVYSQFFRHAYDPGQFEIISLAEAYMFSPFLAEFLSGALLAGWLSTRQTGASWSLLLGGTALFLMGGWLNNAWFDGHIEHGYYIFWRVLVFGTASLFILAGLVRLEFREKKTALRFSLAAGGASYAIYLCHALWLMVTQHLGLNSYLGQFSAWIVQLVFLAYAVFILYYSMWHYRMIEQPLHRLFKKWLRIAQ